MQCNLVSRYPFWYKNGAMFGFGLGLVYKILIGNIFLKFYSFINLTGERLQAVIKFVANL